MDFSDRLSENIVQLARLGLSGRAQDVQAYLRQSIRKLRSEKPELAAQLSELLALAPTTLTPLRDFGGGVVPVDADSRLALAKNEFFSTFPDTPILPKELVSRIEQVVAEQKQLSKLESQGLGPTRSLLFVGPPGVGKTITARWLSSLLKRPLITLDLATVMSSYLGKTGSNIRAVLEYAKSVESVLLLDEFDSIAKKRDDEGDVGELKRLVTVLLQEIDDWPSTSLLIAATNHGELLDPAVWRRFDDVLVFELPEQKERTLLIKNLLGDEAEQLEHWLPLLAEVWKNQSFSDITRIVRWMRRRAATTNTGLTDVLIKRLGDDFRNGSPVIRKKAADLLAASGFSDRSISEFVGISRDTIRKDRRATSGNSSKKGHIDG